MRPGVGLAEDVSSEANPRCWWLSQWMSCSLLEFSLWIVELGLYSMCQLDVFYISPFSTICMTPCFANHYRLKLLPCRTRRCQLLEDELWFVMLSRLSVYYKIIMHDFAKKITPSWLLVTKWSYAKYVNFM